MMHYTFFLFGLCTALDESTTTVAPSAQGPSSDDGSGDGCQMQCPPWAYPYCIGCRKCKDDFKYEKITGVGRCKKQCRCPGGTAAEGPDCPEAGALYCTKCSSDVFKKIGNICVPQCTCRGGTPKNAPACASEPGKNTCKTCNPAFWKDGDQCRYRRCTCDITTGLPAVGTNCKLSNGKPTTQCSKCRGQYILDPTSSLCKLPDRSKCDVDGDCLSGTCGFNNDGKNKTCRCTTNCAFVGSTIVNSDFREDATQCIKLCSQKSPLGDAAVYTFLGNVSRPKHNCQCLASGAHPSFNSNATSGLVKKTQCSCTNGKAVNGQCPTANEDQCSKCNDGYLLVGHKCIPKICKCNNGIGAVGPNCPLVGALKCAACNFGTHFETNKLIQSSVKQKLCVTNQCQCNNGQAAIGPLCPINGAKKCLPGGCEKGYFYENDKCKKKQCTCVFGNAASGLTCPKNGDAYCDNCYPNYKLKTNKNGLSTGICIFDDDEDVLV